MTKSVFQATRIRNNLVLALLCAFTMALKSSPTLPPQVGDYRLVFSDNFANLDLGTTRNGTFAKSHTWYEGIWFERQHPPPDRFSTENPGLCLTWKRGQPQPDSSISTFSSPSQRFLAWRYGYFETRMKWRPEPGAWPAFWLIPVQSAMDTAPHDSGEIDVFEGQGAEPHTFFGTIHRWRGSQHLESTSSHNRFPLPPNTDFSQFHTYGLLWVPGHVTWYFDDKPLHSEPTYAIFDQQDYFLILGMQEGSDWKEGNLDGVTAQSLSLHVAWVRVWQLNSK